ncbi:hypothetical protein ACSSS7_000690 [Eimeria intestinalis]
MAGGAPSAQLMPPSLSPGQPPPAPGGPSGGPPLTGGAPSLRARPDASGSGAPESLCLTPAGGCCLSSLSPPASHSPSLFSPRRSSEPRRFFGCVLAPSSTPRAPPVYSLESSQIRGQLRSRESTINSSTAAAAAAAAAPECMRLRAWVLSAAQGLTFTGPVCRGNTNCPASASLSQRKQARQPRRRAQRIKAKERPSVCSAHGASSSTTAAAGAAAAGGKSSEAKGGVGAQPAPGGSSGKEASSRKYPSWRHQPRHPADSLGEGCLVSVSPASSCCAASITSESRSGRTCSSSSGAAEVARHRAKRQRENAGSSTSTARKASSSSAATASSRASEAAASARVARRGPKGGAPVGPPREYPAVHACRPRIFFITLSSVKRRAILRLSLAASRRGLEGEEAPSPSSLGGPSSSLPSWDNCAKLETTTTITTAATDKLGSPPPPTAAWPPLLPLSAAAADAAADTKTAEDTETSATGEDA